MRDYGKLFESVKKACLFKLKMNEFKNGWLEGDIEDYLFKARQENREAHDALVNLEDAVWESLRNPSPENKKFLLMRLEELKYEAADMINFPAFIIDICDREIERLENEEK